MRCFSCTHRSIPLSILSPYRGSRRRTGVQDIVNSTVDKKESRGGSRGGYDGDAEGMRMAHGRNKNWRSCISHYPSLDKPPAGIGSILITPFFSKRSPSNSCAFCWSGSGSPKSIKIALESRVSESIVHGPAIIDDLPLPGESYSVQTMIDNTDCSPSPT